MKNAWVTNLQYLQMMSVVLGRTKKIKDTLSCKTSDANTNPKDQENRMEQSTTFVIYSSWRNMCGSSVFKQKTIIQNVMIQNAQMLWTVIPHLGVLGLTALALVFVGECT